MKRSVLLLALLTQSAGPAVGLEYSNGVLTLAPEEVTACKSEGGCVIYTVDALRSMLIDAKRSGAISCGNRT